MLPLFTVVLLILGKWLATKSQKMTNAVFRDLVTLKTIATVSASKLLMGLLCVVLARWNPHITKSPMTAYYHLT
jgi:hypothetical protein